MGWKFTFFKQTTQSPEEPIIFWMIYYTGPMGIALFVKNNVNRTLLHFNIPTQWLLNINSIAVVVCAPVLVYLIGAAGVFRRKPTVLRLATVFV